VSDRDAADDALPAYPPGLTPETKIRIDREGRFWNDGDPIVHEGLERALASWVGIEASTGRYILRNSINWCYVTVDDAPLVVRTLGVGTQGELVVTLSDGSIEPLDLSTLRLDREDVPYCDVKGKRIPARFARAAAFALLERITPDDEGEPVLCLDAWTMRIPRVERGAARLYGG
jgi:hypothetical protein